MTAVGDAPKLAKAQTTIQLYEQLRACNYSQEELRAIRSACDCARRNLAGRVCGSGKTSLSHAIGLASILTSLELPADVIAAGLVHAAYRRGDFGPWRPLLTLKRRRLRHDVGRRVEEIVYGYHSLAWNSAAVAAMADRAERLSEADRTSVILALANELEALRDRGLLYRADAERVSAGVLRRGAAWVQIAEKVGLPQLAAAVSGALDEMRQNTVPPQRRSGLGRVFVMPRSTTTRFEAVCTRWVHGLFRRVRG